MIKIVKKEYSVPKNIKLTDDDSALIKAVFTRFKKEIEKEFLVTEDFVIKFNLWD